MDLQTKKIGWIQGIFNIVVLWGVAHIGIGYCAKILHVNTILFACIAFASSALFLLLFGGYGKLAKETIKSLDTWGYGVILLLTYIAVFLLFSKVSATEGSLLLLFGMNVSFLASWFFFSRKPNKGQILGNLIVFTGLILTCYDTPKSVQLSVYTMVIVLGLLTAIRFFIAENHKPHTQAMESTDPKSKSRVIAFVMFVVSLIFTSVTVIIATIRHFYSLDSEQFLGFPTLVDFLNPYTVFAGLIYGAILMAPLRYLEFASTSKIKGENYATIMALAPASTLLWEWLTHGLTGLSLETITGWDLFACILITSGAFLAAYSQLKKTNKINNYENFLKYSPQNLEEVEETRAYIIGALENFKNNLAKTASALDLKIDVIEAIMADKKHVLALKGDVLKQVTKNYRKNVAEGDYLTGLLNKAGFHIAFRDVIAQSDQLSLFFIDLNKFKPVNDKYGHDAGDFILAETGKRLKELFGDNALVTRYGGDEYGILIKDMIKDDAVKMVDKITSTIEKDIVWQDHIINISGSVGLANYPEDTNNPKDLIKLSDQQMFTNKSER